MKCQKCNFLNPPSSIYCAACGAVLEEEIEIVDDIIVDDVIEELPQQQFIQSNVVPPVNPIISEFNNVEVKQSSSMEQVSTNLSFSDLLKMVISVLIKPISILKNNSTNFELPKNAFILNAIVSSIMTIGLFLIAVILEVRVVEFSLFGPSEKTWVLSNIKNVDYINVLYNLLGFMIANMIIALVFFIGSKVFKKQVSYFKFLSIVSLASSPMVLGTLFACTIFFMPYQIFLTLSALSCTYFVILLIYFINETVKFDKENGSIYYMLSCYGTISVLGSILISIRIEQAVMSVLNSIGF